MHAEHRDSALLLYCAIEVYRLLSKTEHQDSALLPYCAIEGPETAHRVTHITPNDS